MFEPGAQIATCVSLRVRWTRPEKVASLLLWRVHAQLLRLLEVTAHDRKSLCDPLADLQIVPLRGVFEVPDGILVVSDNLVEKFAFELLAGKPRQPFAFHL